MLMLFVEEGRNRRKKKVVEVDLLQDNAKDIENNEAEEALEEEAESDSVRQLNSD